MARFLAKVVLGATAALTATALVLALASASDAPAPEDLVFVTDASGASSPGCNSISVVDVRSGRALAHSKYRQDHGRLGVSSDGALVVAVPSWNEQFVAGLRRTSVDPPIWSAFMTSYPVPPGSPITVARDDSVLLLARSGSVVEKHLLSEMAGNALGPVRGRYTKAQAAEIVFSHDSSVAYVVGMRGFVHIVDIQSMTAAEDPIPYRRVYGQATWQMRNTFASLSPDGRYLAINTATNQVNVVDLVARANKLMDTPGLTKTFDLEFNYAYTERSYLAVSSHGTVAAYVFDGSDVLVPLHSIRVPAQKWGQAGAERLGADRYGTLAWTGSGDGVVVAIDGAKEFRVLDFQPDEEQVLRRRLDFDGCKSDIARYTGFGFDVISLNGRYRTPTPTVTQPPTATEPPPPTATVPTATLTLTPSPSPTQAVTETPTEMVTSTTVPSPVYLPLSLRETCDPELKRADIALVLDTSSSMTGKKIEDAKSAALLFVGMIDLEPGRSQVAVVRYDREADVVHELTRSRTLADAAIRSLRVRSGTHIDKGLRAALSELQSPRHLDRNMPVMILLTDGLQTGTPGEELRAAAEVRDAGVRLYAVGLGSDVDETALKTMAGDESRYYHAPDSTDLARIYAEIAQDLMCPGKEFWGGR